MNNEMPDEIELGLFYAPAPMSEHFYSVIDAETKMTPVASAKYVRADKAVPDGWKPIKTAPDDTLVLVWWKNDFWQGKKTSELFNNGENVWSVKFGDSYIAANPTHWMHRLQSPPSEE